MFGRQDSQSNKRSWSFLNQLWSTPLFGLIFSSVSTRRRLQVLDVTKQRFHPENVYSAAVDTLDERSALIWGWNVSCLDSTNVYELFCLLLSCCFFSAPHASGLKQVVKLWLIRWSSVLLGLLDFQVKLRNLRMSPGNCTFSPLVTASRYHYYLLHPSQLAGKNNKQPLFRSW